MKGGDEMGVKENHFIRVLSRIQERANELDPKTRLFGVVSSYDAELFYARQSGRFQGLIANVLIDLRSGKDIESIEV